MYAFHSYFYFSFSFHKNDTLFSSLNYMRAFSENIKFAEIASYLADSLMMSFCFSFYFFYTMGYLLFLAGPRSPKTQS